jgi:hypothetical protein
MVISNNTYPLNVLSTLGISVKTEKGKASLPEALSNYLDTIIKANELENLFEAAPQVINAAEEIAKQDPRVALNALLAMTKSSDLMGEQVGLSSCAGEEGAKKADPRLLKMHQASKDLYTKIAGQVGIVDNGLFLSIQDRTKFNAFLKNMADQKVEIGEKEKEYFNNLLIDDLTFLTGTLQSKPLDANKLLESAETIRLIKDGLGIENITTSTTQTEIPLKRIPVGLRAIAFDVQEDKEPKLLQPLLNILSFIE